MKTIHMVCARLRNKPCKECPAWEKDKDYGKMQRGCYGLARELINIVKRGGPFKKVTANRIWRKRAAKWRGKEVL
jgi:hypothetical protein